MSVGSFPIGSMPAGSSGMSGSSIDPGGILTLPYPNTRYTITRDAIEQTLLSIVGVGQIFNRRKFVTDWTQFFALYKAKDDDLFRVVFFWLKSARENTEDYDDAAYLKNGVMRIETWAMEYYHGENDSDETVARPSEEKFNLVCEKIEERFRFDDNLGGVCFRVEPLTRVFSGLWNFEPGGVLSHRAEWELTIAHQIIRT